MRKIKLCLARLHLLAYFHLRVRGVYIALSCYPAKRCKNVTRSQKYFLEQKVRMKMAIKGNKSPSDTIIFYF